MSDDTTSPALPATADGQNEAVSALGTQESLKDILGQALNKQFPSDEIALKAAKDTFSFVGKAGKFQEHMKTLTTKLGKDEHEVLSFMENIAQNPEPQVTQPGNDFTQELNALKEQVQEATFFGDHPEFKEHKDLIKEFRGSTGKSYTEVIESPTFKKVYESVRTAEQIEKSKSVLHSNPRLGQVRDKLTEAKEAANAGNFDAAKTSAVAAVLDSLQ